MPGLDLQEDVVIKIFIIHSSRLVCETIAALLKDERDIIVTGYATNMDGVLSRLDSCDVVLVSVKLPNDEALRLTQMVTDMALNIKVLVMGLIESGQAILRYVEAGAAGYIRRKESAQELAQNIRAAYNNKALISPQIAALLISRISELSDVGLDTDPNNSYKAYDLTPREREVLELMVQGSSNRQIAEKLVIEVGTVKNHVHNILKKLDLNSRRDVANYVATVNDIQ